MSEDITRRKLLRAGTGAAALGAVGSLSGCSAIRDLLPGGGGGGLGNYTNWVYEPDAYQSEREGLNVSATSYTTFFSNSGNLSELAVLSTKTRNYPDLGINVEDISMELSLPDGRVITGSFDTEAVQSELTAEPVDTPTPSGFGGGSSGRSGSTQYEEDGSHNNYTIYVQSEPDNSPNAYAVGDGTVIEAQRVQNGSDDAVDAPEVAEGIIDTGSEGSDRYVDSSDPFSALTDSLNNGVEVSANVRSDAVGSDDGADENVSLARFDGLVADGRADSINGGTTQTQYVYVFDSDGDVNEDDINEWIEANNTGDGTLANLNDISVNTDGNTATVTGTRDTLEYGL